MKKGKIQSNTTSTTTSTTFTTTTSSKNLIILFLGIYLTFVGISSTAWKVGKTTGGQLGLEKLCAQVKFIEYEYCNLDLSITDDNYFFYAHYITKHNDQVRKDQYKRKLFTKDECETWADFIVAIWVFSGLSIFLTVITFQTILTKHETSLYPISKYMLFTTVVVTFFCLISSFHMISSFSVSNTNKARGFDLFIAYCYLSIFMLLYSILRNLTSVNSRLNRYELIFLFDAFGCMVSLIMLILIGFAVSDSRWLIIGVGSKIGTVQTNFYQMKNIDPYFFAGMDKQANEMFKVGEIMPNETLVFNEIGFFAPSVSTKHTTDPYENFFVNNFLSVNLGGVSYCKDVSHKFDLWSSVPLFAHGPNYDTETTLYLIIRILAYSMVCIYALTVIFMLWDNFFFMEMKKYILYFAVGDLVLMILCMELLVSITKTNTSYGYVFFIIGSCLFLFALFKGNYKIQGINSNYSNICRKKISLLPLIFQNTNNEINLEQSTHLIDNSTVE